MNLYALSAACLGVMNKEEESSTPGSYDAVNGYFLIHKKNKCISRVVCFTVT